MQLIELERQPEHNHQPGKIMCMQEGMVMSIEGIITGTSNSEIMASGVPDQGAPRAVKNKLIVNISPDNKVHGSIVITIAADRSQTAAMATEQVNHRAIAHAEEAVEDNMIFQSL
jgi:hypothetical protein